MQPQNLMLSFLIELAQRLRTKKPKFFVYLQWITTVLGAVTGIPALLIDWGVKLSPALAIFENKFVAACSVGFVIASQLTTASPVATVTKDGAVLTQTDQSKLPFTSRTEIKKAQNSQIPNSDKTLEQVKELPK